MLQEISRNFPGLQVLDIISFCKYGSAWKVPRRHQRHTHGFEGGSGAIARSEIGNIFGRNSC